jgi:hypothetical protein
MAKTLAALVWTLIILAPLSARAQSYESIGIRAQGMAGAFVAVADDATASWWNPAGLATSQAFADLIVMADEKGNGGVAFGFPSLGLSYYRLNISQIQPSNSIAPAPSSRQDPGATGTGLPLGSFDLDQFGVTTGQSIGRHFVVASTLKLVRALSDTKVDIDFGTMASIGVLRLGLTVKNLNSPTFGEGEGAFELPLRTRAGVAVVTPALGPIDRLTLAFDADLTTTAEHVVGREERHIAGGAEAWVFGRRLGGRVGMGMNTLGERRSFTAFGASVSPFRRVYLDGAMTLGPDQTQDRWGLGLRLTF